MEQQTLLLIAGAALAAVVVLYVLYLLWSYFVVASLKVQLKREEEHLAKVSSEYDKKIAEFRKKAK